MSEQRSLEQQRAAAAWRCVGQVKSDNEQLGPRDRYAKEYCGLAKSAPADIQASGLGQTLAFWRAKGYEKGQPKSNGANEHYQLLEHVSNWVGQRLGLQERNMVKWVAEHSTTDAYRRATLEAIAFLIWVKRFAEAELD